MGAGGVSAGGGRAQKGPAFAARASQREQLPAETEDSAPRGLTLPAASPSGFPVPASAEAAPAGPTNRRPPRPDQSETRRLPPPNARVARLRISRQYPSPRGARRWRRRARCRPPHASRPFLAASPPSRPASPSGGGVRAALALPLPRRRAPRRGRWSRPARRGSAGAGPAAHKGGRGGARAVCQRRPRSSADPYSRPARRAPWPAGREARPGAAAAATATPGEAGRAPGRPRGRAGRAGRVLGPLPPDAAFPRQPAAPREMEPRPEARSRREAQEARGRRGPREAGGRPQTRQVGRPGSRGRLPAGRASGPGRDAACGAPSLASQRACPSPPPPH